DEPVSTSLENALTQADLSKADAIQRQSWRLCRSIPRRTPTNTTTQDQKHNENKWFYVFLIIVQYIFPVKRSDGPHFRASQFLIVFL
ncbi:MAG: hypothetical protein KDJ45_02650, partial [Hyphomicrobiaceae bacterium]|nr:hypothetical protein [Hyphomicrobiaceae bacterium]